MCFLIFFFFKQKTAYEMRISDWSSDVCSSDLADLPVVLIADIDRGGVIASLVGSHAVLGEAEARRVAGYVVNKFRGDASLFDDGLAIVTARTGWPALGVVPFFPDAGKLPAEDAVALSRRPAAERRAIKVAVPQLHPLQRQRRVEGKG